MLERMAREMKRALMTDFLQSAQALGISVDEIIAFLTDPANGLNGLSEAGKDK